MRDERLARWRRGTPKTLLLATDWSARCDRPLDRAIQLAHYWGAWLIVLTVVEEAPTGADRDAIVQRIKARILREMPAIDLRFHIDVKFGSVADRVLELAAAHQADLVVTGVARHTALGGYILGTAVDRLVRSPPAPLLVVKLRPRFAYQKVVVATDYSACASDSLATLPAFPRAKIALVDARERGLLETLGFDKRRGPTEVERARLIASIAPELQARLEVRTIEGRVADALPEFVEREEGELTIVCRHGDGREGELLAGTAATLIDRLPSDVLLLPAPPAAG